MTQIYSVSFIKCPIYEMEQSFRKYPIYEKTHIYVRTYI